MRDFILRSGVRMTLMAAAVACAFAPSSAFADQWIVSPTRDTSPTVVTRQLVQSGFGAKLNSVLVALAGSSALAKSYRLIDLSTGAVRVLSALELAQLGWLEGGKLVDATIAAADGATIVLVLSDYDGMGAAVVTLAGDRVTHATVLTADQRLLVGEPPCDKGFVPESSPAGSICVDVDECDAALDNCADDAECANTDGSWKCTCNAGFKGDGVMCVAPSTMDGEAGMGAADAGAPDEMETSDAGSTTSDGEMPKAGDSGCSCDLSGHSTRHGMSSFGAFVGLLGFGLVLRRRRARARVSR